MESFAAVALASTLSQSVLLAAAARAVKCPCGAEGSLWQAPATETFQARALEAG